MYYALQRSSFCATMKPQCCRVVTGLCVHLAPARFPLLIDKQSPPTILTGIRYISSYRILGKSARISSENKQHELAKPLLFHHNHSQARSRLQAQRHYPFLNLVHLSDAVTTATALEHTVFHFESLFDFSLNLEISAKLLTASISNRFSDSRIGRR
jgi:hypothetical protein